MQTSAGAFVKIVATTESKLKITFEVLNNNKQQEADSVWLAEVEVETVSSLAPSLPHSS